MVESIRHAADLAANSTHDSVFTAWRSLYEEQDGWSQEKGCPPLLAHLGTALVERMLIDGFCRGAGLSFLEAVRSNALGIDLRGLHPELVGRIYSRILKLGVAAAKCTLTAVANGPIGLCGAIVT